MAKKLFDLDTDTPQIMAVLNVTPDSFSDGGSYFSADKLSVDLCYQRVESMVEQGATIIDIGGESTRPGSEIVSLQEEMDRVLPVIEAIKDLDIVISLDSSSPELMSEAAGLGVGLFNDVRALKREGALQVAAQTDIPVCLMHMQGQPDSMQASPEYSDVLDEVSDFFAERVQACTDAGIKRSNVLLDPGFGFGKTMQHNATILANLNRFASFQLPILVGLSRKSMIDHLLGGRELQERLPASLALAVMAVERGAWIVRCHDIKETADSVQITAKIINEHMV